MSCRYAREFNYIVIIRQLLNIDDEDYQSYKDLPRYGRVGYCVDGSLQVIAFSQEWRQVNGCWLKKMLHENGYTLRF